MVYLSCRRYQTNMTLLTAMASWCRSFPEHFSPFWNSCAIVGVSLGSIPLVFYNILNLESSSSEATHLANQLNVVGAVFYWPGIAVFFVSTMRCLYRLIRQMRNTPTVVRETFSTTTLGNKHKKGSHEKDEENMFFPFLYLLSGVACFMIILVIFIAIGSPIHFTPKLLLLNNLAYIFLNLCMLSFCLRRVKHNANKNLYQLIDSKKSYVRYIRCNTSLPFNDHVFSYTLSISDLVVTYICLELTLPCTYPLSFCLFVFVFAVFPSHELRTPLNSAFLGLKHVLNTMLANSNTWTPDDKDTYETLTDIHKSCLTTVDILVSHY